MINNSHCRTECFILKFRHWKVSSNGKYKIAQVTESYEASSSKRELFSLGLLASENKSAPFPPQNWIWCSAAFTIMSNFTTERFESPIYTRPYTTFIVRNARVHSGNCRRRSQSALWWVPCIRMRRSLTRPSETRCCRLACKLKEKRRKFKDLEVFDREKLHKSNSTSLIRVRKRNNIY